MKITYNPATAIITGFASKRRLRFFPLPAMAASWFKPTMCRPISRTRSATRAWCAPLNRFKSKRS